MSISLKIQNANEILEAMAETLQSEEFKGLYKKAADEAPLKSEPAHVVPQTSTKPDSTEQKNQKYNSIAQKLFNKVIGELTKEQMAQVKAQYKKMHPQSADDDVVQNVDDKEETKKLYDEAEKKKKEDEAKKAKEYGKDIPAPPKSPSADDAVIAYTIQHLTKIANALDSNGYAGLANVIDETIDKVAQKKTK